MIPEGHACQARRARRQTQIEIREQVHQCVAVPGHSLTRYMYIHDERTNAYERESFDEESFGFVATGDDVTKAET